MAITNGTNDVLECTVEGSVLKLLKYFHDKYDREHSLNYTFEECLVAGIQAKQRSKEYSEETQNRKKFERALASDPSVITDPERMKKLCAKFGIGGTRVASFVVVESEAESEPLSA